MIRNKFRVKDIDKLFKDYCYDLFSIQLQRSYKGGVLKSMLTLNEAIIDVKEG